MSREEMFYEYENTKMFFKKCGSGIPFLFIHGWAIDHTYLENAFEPVFKNIEGFERIYVDLPGMGRSSLGNVKNGDDMVSILINFMRERYCGKKFYICGNSFGTAVARRVYQKDDNAVGMILITPVYGIRKKLSGKKEYFYVDNELLAALPVVEREHFLSMNSNICREVYEKYKRCIYPSFEANRNNPNLHGKLIGEFSASVEEDELEKKKKGPVLILTGKYDNTTGYEEQIKLVGLFDPVEYVVMGKCGHNLYADDTETFESITSAWIRKIKDNLN